MLVKYKEIIKMKIFSLSHILIFLMILISSAPSYSTNLREGYIKELQKISHIKGFGSNKLESLIGNSSNELVESWSPKLAKELARVFNELLNVNQNFYLIELIDPSVKKYPKKFVPILQQALSKKNRKLYKELVKMDITEEREGNG